MIRTMLPLAALLLLPFAAAGCAAQGRTPSAAPTTRATTPRPTPLPLEEAEHIALAEIRRQGILWPQIGQPERTRDFWIFIYAAADSREIGENGAIVVYDDGTAEYHGGR